MKIWDKTTATYTYKNDCWWSGASEEEALEGLAEFFAGNKKLIKKILNAITELRDLVLSQRTYVFHESSLLIAYEGGAAHPTFKDYDVVLIDFGHVEPYSRSALHKHEIVEGYNQLLHMLNNLKKNGRFDLDEAVREAKEEGAKGEDDMTESVA